MTICHHLPTLMYKLYDLLSLVKHNRRYYEKRPLLFWALIFIVWTKTFFVCFSAEGKKSLKFGITQGCVNEDRCLILIEISL